MPDVGAANAVHATDAGGALDGDGDGGGDGRVGLRLRLLGEGGGAGCSVVVVVVVVVVRGDVGGVERVEVEGGRVGVLRVGVVLVLVLGRRGVGGQEVVEEAFARFGPDALLSDDGGLAGEGAVPCSFVLDREGWDEAGQREREGEGWGVSVGAVEVVVELVVRLVRAVVGHGRAACFAVAVAERRTRSFRVAVLGAARMEAVEVLVFGDADAEVFVVRVVGEVVEAFLQGADAASVGWGLRGAFDGTAGEPGAFGVDRGEGLREESA